MQLDLTLPLPFDRDPEPAKSRDAALERVVEGEEPEQTTEYALGVLRGFLYALRGKDFIWEEFREWAINSSLLEPAHHHNWWGAICMTAARRKVIVKNGQYRPMRSRSAHARQSPCYVAGQ